MSAQGRGISDRGTVLVLTLWLLALLSALALNFALSARTGSAITRNFKESVMLRALAVEAIENTVAYLLADPEPLVDYVDEDGFLRTDDQRPPASGSMTLGEATVYVTLSAEDARLNINETDDRVLRDLIKAANGKEEGSGALLAALRDWIDTNSLHRLNGAEDDYYLTLGYEAADEPLTVVDELLLVKGFDNTIVRGEDGLGGLSSSVTTFAHTVNINAAPVEVLDALGMDSVGARSLIDQRTSSKGLRRVPSNFLTKGTTFSNVFRIEVQASLPESPQVYHITSVLEKIRGSKGQELKTIYWKENIETGGA